MFAKKPLVTIDANAAWSSDQKHILIVQYTFRPNKINQPWFNAHDADDWNIKCLEMNSISNQRKEIAIWENMSRDGGGIMQHPVFWIRGKKRIVFTESQIPSIYQIDKQKAIELRPPEAIILKLAGKELAPGVSGYSPIPSPNEKTIAVWFTTSYIKGGPLGPQIFTHFVSFFNSDDGKHIRSQPLPFNNKELDPWLEPQSGIPGFRYGFIWKKDSSGIFIISRKESWVVGVEQANSLTSTNMVPKFSVPTNSGSVSNDGKRVYIEINKTGPNKTILKFNKINNWTSFENVPMVLANEIQYAKP